MMTRTAQPPGGGATWHSYAVAFGATSIVIGAIWDISWHSTIGRDTFWTPAHMAIYLGGLRGGLTGGWLVLRTTFWSAAAERGAAVKVWGFRGPLGAWVLIWGALVMVVSAPFDDWWHYAYGLDVEILSPPHTVLAVGIFMIGIGAVLILLAQENRASLPEEDSVGEVNRLTGPRKVNALLCVYSFGILLTMLALFLTDFSYPNHQRSGSFYLVSCLAYPVFHVAAARVSSLRWGATLAAAAYMAINLLMAWILPRFPAQPLLAPIYNPVDHMVPPPFPLLLVAPAIGIDLVKRWVGCGQGLRRDWLLVFLAGAVFLGLFLPVHWFFSAFLISPAADNWFFVGTHFHAYFYSVGDWTRGYWRTEVDPVTGGTLTRDLTLSLISTRVGLWGGNWMARVKR